MVAVLVHFGWRCGRISTPSLRFNVVTARPHLRSNPKDNQNKYMSFSWLRNGAGHHVDPAPELLSKS